jgi:hypothetical protein
MCIKMFIRFRTYSYLLIPVLLYAGASLHAQAAEVPQRDPVKLLTVGNSFADDATSYLPDIAKAGGRELVLFRANLPGCPLERHARHLGLAVARPDAPEGSPYKNHPVLKISGKDMVSLPEALGALDWDYVTIQQLSAFSFKADTYEPYAQQLVASIKKHSPGAQILVHQTWAYREDHKYFQRGDGFTQEKMCEQLSAAYGQLAKRYGLRILPSGEAMQAARQTPRWQYRPDPDFDFKNPSAGLLPEQRGSLNIGWVWKKNQDGVEEFILDASHANVAGRYLTACVFYEGLFGDDVREVSFVPESLLNEDAADLRRIAHSIVLGKAKTAVQARR